MYPQARGNAKDKTRNVKRESRSAKRETKDKSKTRNVKREMRNKRNGRQTHLAFFTRDSHFVYTEEMIIRELQNFPAAMRGCVVCVGNFDGVHVGHARMLATAREIAQPAGAPVVAMTFDPHPSTLIFPDVPRPMLTSLEQRIELLKSAGADAVIVQHVSQAYLKMPAESFLDDILKQTLAARHVVEGTSFTFGYKALGTVELLKLRAPVYGYGVTIVPTVERTLADKTVAGVSSTMIRFLVSHGRMNDAAECLGRPFTLRGEVVHGYQRGRKIGFPTANVATAQILPAPAVYAGVAVLPSGARHAAAISVGTNPTFAGEKLTVEAYLLDYDGDLYDQVLNIEFGRWLRDQVTFGGVDQLVAQLKKDVQNTRKIIETR